MINLAIVIPYYKLTFFKDTLDSLAKQTNKNFNVYIGNDASLYNPENLINQYKGKFNFSYKKFEENIGKESLVKQWQRCINLTKDEEWIMILGDDDCISENVVQQFYKNFQDFGNKANVVRYSSQMIFADDKKSKIYKHPTFESPIKSYLRKVNGESRSSLSEHIFKKSVYKKFNFSMYPLGWHSDDKAWLDFSQEKPIYTINDSLIWIRVSRESISGKKDNLDVKKEAKINFYKDLVTQNASEYKVKIRLELLLLYEIAIKHKRKLTREEWKFLFFKYLSNFRFIPLLKLVRRFFIALKL